MTEEGFVYSKWNDMKQYVAKTSLEMFYLCVADIDNLKQDELTDTTFAVLDKLQIIKARLPLLKAAGYDNLHSDVAEKVSHLEVKKKKKTIFEKNYRSFFFIVYQL